MDVQEIVGPSCELASQPAVVAIAIKGNGKSKCVVAWALEKFIPKGITRFQLLNVRPRITAAPTERDQVIGNYNQEVGRKMLLPYKEMCAQKKAQGEIKVIESDDVAKAIAEEIANCNTKKLVIGAASYSLFSRFCHQQDNFCRKPNKNNISTRISVSTPSFCTVYAVLKGQLHSIRPSQLGTSESIKDNSSDATGFKNSSSSSTSNSETDLGSVSSSGHYCSSAPPKVPFQGLSAKTLLQSRLNHQKQVHSRCHSLDIEEEKDSMNSGDSGQTVRRSSSYRRIHFLTDSHNQSELVSPLNVQIDYSSSASQVSAKWELEKLKIELGYIQGMHKMVQTEEHEASQQLKNLNDHQLDVAAMLKEKNQQGVESARQEKSKIEAARREANNVRKRAEGEASPRQEDLEAAPDAKEKEKLENALQFPEQQYHRFTWEEIETATSSFSENLEIGMGAYGTVYKCNLHHTIAAVKVLRAKGIHETKHFHKELEILSKMHHPHLLLLLGACPDHGVLVYEYMEIGSLEDRLYRRNNTPPIPWYDRFQIAWEVASALVFLHNSKPKPIIHCDLKPANILLDRNFVSKIGDVGLSTMLSSDPSHVSSTYKETGPVGTFCYIDPEYQRTGLISPKSDVYAFGMVILQLLTAKEPIALAHIVETAVNRDKLVDILDSHAGNWPINETKELATLGLSCAELRRKDRPDLKDQVFPTLKRLKEVADKARCSASKFPCVAPDHFICPLLKDVMSDPCVAADGYSYDRKAMEEWLRNDDESPITHLPLSNKNLLPNYSLLSAIEDWKSKHS
ncbi:hypothetical protein Pint_18043 [Pistacia integerrima]|uniref:Uncharacterized protein n=1 Tax=Pistacia integerrima TaxID=434235 RepID=A0ACC0YSZ0_9ROSI|nr:hypothetical protein Pint_18043 [Pistacia integerrima]